ncbi:MAG: amidase [Austwickia sp.]|nr:amidase [Austwickia sp.]MBK8436152.1 amidase [Austwickia sp.]
MAELARVVRDGSCSADELVSLSRARIAATEEDLAAWVALAPEGAGAKRPTGPLAGIPLGVKDIIDVAGLPTRCGSSTTSPDPVATTAPLVSALTALGAVVVGKTVTTEFAYFAPGPTANPRDLRRTPGGSSSGSAAAVGAGQVPLAFASQTAGSTIRPASYCGIAGMVAPHGTLDMTGWLSICPSLDSPGLFARTVADLVTALEAAFPRLAARSDGARVAQVLCWDGSGLDELDPEMTAAVQRAAGMLREQGYAVSELGWDEELRTLSADHLCVMASEMAHQLTQRLAPYPEQVSPQLAALLTSGAAIPESTYREALDRRDQLRTLLAERLADDQVILGPGTPGPAPLGHAGTGAPSMNRPWQQLGWPQVAVPGAQTEEGLPLGLALIGRPGQEAQLLRVGAQLEGALTRG